MSPEQAEGDTGHVGFASDVYGLGATLYYLLTGQNPITDREVTTALRHARRGEFLRPREVNPEIPLPLEAICLKAMAYRAEDRFDSPRMLAHDLELWLADEPVSAWPEPLRLKLRRWVIRNRTLVSSAAAALLVAPGDRRISGLRVQHEEGPPPDRSQCPGGLPLDGRGPLGAADRRTARCRPVTCPGAAAFSGEDRATSAGRIGAALALLPDDRSQAQSLVDHLAKPEATPEELLVIRDGLRRNNALEPFVEPLIAGLPPASERLGDAAIRRSACWRWPDPAGAGGRSSPIGSPPSWCRSIRSRSRPGGRSFSR